MKSQYQKESIKQTSSCSKPFFEIYLGKERRLVHSNKGGDGEPNYDRVKDFVDKLTKKLEA